MTSTSAHLIPIISNKGNFLNTFFLIIKLVRKSHIKVTTLNAWPLKKHYSFSIILISFARTLGGLDSAMIPLVITSTF